MPKHQSEPVDSPGYSAILDKAKLNVMESAALTTLAREWKDLAFEASGTGPLWREFSDLYMSARSIFLRKFFEVQ
jgi:hypothetical protein